MLDKKLINKWVKALRSGRYEQGQGTMRQRGDDGKLEYCCLGVLCNVINHDGWKSHTVRDMDNKPYEVFSFGTDSHRVCPPMEVRDKLGPISVWDLVNKNDTKHWSFSKIADYIETETKS